MFRRAIPQEILRLTGRECICGRILQLNAAGVCCEFREMALLKKGGKVLTATWSGDMI